MSRNEAVLARVEALDGGYVWEKEVAPAALTADNNAPRLLSLVAQCVQRVDKRSFERRQPARGQRRQA
jgi:hypothetical protein